MPDDFNVSCKADPAHSGKKKEKEKRKREKIAGS